MDKTLGIFLKRNISGLITLTAAIMFLILRLLLPDYVKSNVADVLLMISLPMFILNYVIVYKIDEHKEFNENLKNEILETLGYKFKTFDRKDSCDDYYKSLLIHSNIVMDLTWAETNSFSSTPNENYFNNISTVKEYSEIFIFKINGKCRNDRIQRLKYIYELIKNNPSLYKNYSCAYYEETSFERLQFTIFDEKEALFTSSYYQRCSIQERSLVSVLIKYYRKSWEEAILLIREGTIENEEAILKIISVLK